MSKHSSRYLWHNPIWQIAKKYTDNHGPLWLVVIRSLRRADPRKVKQRPDSRSNRFTSWRGRGTHSTRIMHNYGVPDDTNIWKIWNNEMDAWRSRKSIGAFGKPLLRNFAFWRLERTARQMYFILKQELQEIRNHWLLLASYFPQPESLADCSIIQMNLDPRIEEAMPIDFSHPSKEGFNNMAPGSGVKRNHSDAEIWRNNRAQVPKNEWRAWANAQIQWQNWRHSLSRLGVPCKILSIEFKAILIIRLKEPFDDPKGITTWLCRFEAVNAAWLVRPLGFNEVSPRFPLWE